MTFGMANSYTCPIHANGSDMYTATVLLLMTGKVIKIMRAEVIAIFQPISAIITKRFYKQLYIYVLMQIKSLINKAG